MSTTISAEQFVTTVNAAINSNRLGWGRTVTVMLAQFVAQQQRLARLLDDAGRADLAAVVRGFALDESAEGHFGERIDGVTQVYAGDFPSTWLHMTGLVMTLVPDLTGDAADMHGSAQDFIEGRVDGTSILKAAALATDDMNADKDALLATLGVAA